MLYLSEDEVKEILTMADCLRAVEAAYHADGLGEAVMIPRQNMYLSRKHSYKILSAAIPAVGVMGTLGYSGGYPRFHSPYECRKLLILFSTETGEPLVCMEAEYLSWLRTGATAGVAVRHLALPEIERVGVLGSGRQSRSSLMAVCAARDIKEAVVFSPTKERRENYAREMSKTLHLPVIPADNPADTVREVEVVITATSHRQPVFFGSWLKPGMTVIALGSHDPDRRELDGETMRAADLIVVDHHEQAALEEGEIILARKEGLLPESKAMVSLGEVIAKKHHGRHTAADKIIFLSGGLALEYIMVGMDIYKRKKG